MPDRTRHQRHAPRDCPVCGDRLALTRLSCQACGTELSGAHDPLHYTQNSPYVALCLALHLGAERIGLIGVDFTEGHFFGRTGKHALVDKLAQIDAEYGRLAHAARQRGVADPNPVVYYPHESTPEIVEAHLRADRHLTPQTAKALSELFRVAYAQFSQPEDKRARKRG